MAISDTEKRLEKNRDNLRREVGLLADYVDLFRRLHKRKRNYCFEINSAPAFFSLVSKSVFSTTILWANKLLDEKGQRGIFDFLKFIEANTGVFSIEKLKRRRNFPDNHWLLERRRKEGEITARQVARHQGRLSKLRCLKSLRARRDKYHAHFDKKYFFDLNRLDLDAPIASRNFGNAVKALWTVVNKYSVAYDGKAYEPTSANINDLDHILYALREYHKHQMLKYSD